MSDEDAQKVGYKRPPIHTRFQKGVSGNPKGRPKKATLNFDQELNARLNRNYFVIRDGKRQRTTLWGILIDKLLKASLVDEKVSSQKYLIELLRSLPAATAPSKFSFTLKIGDESKLKLVAQPGEDGTKT